MKKSILLLITLAFFNCKEANPESENIDFGEETSESTEIVIDSASTFPTEENISFSLFGDEIDFNNLEIPKELELKKYNLTEIPEGRKDLENIRVFEKHYNGKDNTGISVPGFGGVKLGRKESNLNIYYIEYKLARDERGRENIYAIGYSIHFLFKKINYGFDFNNLLKLAENISADGSHENVSYSMKTYGMAGPKLVQFFTPLATRTFDKEGYDLLTKNISGIQKLLEDSKNEAEIRFTPQRITFISKYDLLI